MLITPAREFLIRPETEAERSEPNHSEFDIPVLHPTPASLLDYLPREALVILDDRQALEDAITEVEQQAVLMRQDFIKEGTLPEDFPIPYLTLGEIQDALSGHSTLDLGHGSLAMAEALPLAEADGGLAERFSAGPRFAGRLKPVMDFLGEHHTAGERIVIVSRQARRLSELWEEQMPANELAPPEFIENSLTEGWSFEVTGGGVLHLLTDGEIFGWRRPETRRRARPTAEAPEAGYTDLQVEDYVVHVDHGIGRYLGLVRRAIDGVEREYLCVEYADEAQLFVPIHQADRLTRYVGPDNRTPTLSRLGSTEWKGTKAARQRSCQGSSRRPAGAVRQAQRGARLLRSAEDSPWQQELEASFPYIETDDQMRVIGEVKRDMQSKRPMDRLICGDVGYGKTEVALRAAFKAVMDDKQVAILVPTTVLAQQHLQHLQPAPGGLPGDGGDALPLPHTPAAARDPRQSWRKARWISSSAPIACLSSDVKFKDMGLLIIDEEQRFGVTHKEALKKMRTEVDVLTLTATPIPRTLYMALSGVRDISTINTPPEERLPIVTHVGPYSPKLVKQAILRELERGGQVFFVHNRVQTIGAMLSHLKQLVPEARIAVAHGQMAET